MLMEQELQSHKEKHLFVGPNLAAAAFRPESTLTLRSNTLLCYIFPIKQVLMGAAAAKPEQSATQARVSSSHVATTFSNHNQSVW